MNSTILSSLAVVLSCFALAQDGDPKNPTFETVTVKDLVVVGGMIDLRDNEGQQQSHLAATGGYLKINSLQIMDKYNKESVAYWNRLGIKVSLGEGSEFRATSAEVLGSLPGGSGGLVMITQEGRGGLMLRTTPTGGAVVLVNRSGEEVVTLRADESGRGEVGIWDREGEGRILTPGP